MREGFVGGEQPFDHLNSGRSMQQHLDHDRGINYDQRPSRSALMALAGETIGLIEGRRARRLLSSASAGHSATRRTS